MKHEIAALNLLDPKECVLMMIDYQPQMAFAVSSIEGSSLINNAVALAKTARTFNIPVILTTVSEKGFSGNTFQPIKEALGHTSSIDRSTMNPWEDSKVVQAIESTGRKKIILAGLWTEVCVTMPAISATAQGYTCYVVVDACGGTSTLAHEMAIQRLIQIRTIPLTWLQLTLELQRDWARDRTASQVAEIIIAHAGTYGLGIEYARAMLNEQEAIEAA